VDERMTAEAAATYHQAQIDTFAATDADLVAVYTLNYVDEAIGTALAARRADMPVVLSFTLETDGRLPSGETLAAAIDRTDTETAGYPLHYMINCAHPAHFEHVLQGDSSWRERIRGLRANASKKSHAELESSTVLDDGDPNHLAGRYLGLRTALPALRVIGGGCGTDDRHVAAMAQAFSRH
jgi:S-methylmethionine-dependent homocysteine/selenocysteine methylase